MLDYIRREANTTETENGAAAYATSGSDCLDLYASIGALRRESDEEITARFVRAYTENADMAMKLLFFARDVRGGLGERRVFRTIFSWLAKNEPGSVKKNIAYVAEYGRFDDLLALMGTPCEEEMLALLKTDYIDVGMIHYVDSMKDWQEIAEGPVLAYAKELKEKGIIRHIGLSSHNPQVALEAVKSGNIEVLMFSVNPCYDLQPASEDVEELWAEKNYEGHLVNMDPERQELYEVCQRSGVGITVMKAFGGGDLLDEKLSPAGRALTVNQCIHYALTRPAAASVLVGAHSVEQLRESIAYESASAEEKDYAPAFASFPKISWEGHCMYCSHCAPCPKKIDVASVTKFLNLAKAQGTVPETVREHYEVLPHHAGECIRCGACETRCPFGVPVMENMREAAKIFGK